jgi:hypothetical protein
MIQNMRVFPLRNPDIQGITINDDETLLSQYADDTFLILDGREISLKETLSCFESFYKASGLKMNASKTKAVWVGNKKYSDLILCPESNLHWSHSNFKLLGIEFSLDLNRITEINFSKIFPSHLELRMCHLHTDSIVFHHH